MIEKLDRCFSERFAEHRHSVMPLLIPDYSKQFDIREIFNVELYFLPQSVDFPAIEACYIKQQAQLSILSDLALEFRNKMLEICFCYLSANVNFNNFPAVFFYELNRHIVLL